MSTPVIEARERFLRAITERIPAESIAEIHLFPALRQGGRESAVAVIAAHAPEAYEQGELPPPVGAPPAAGSEAADSAVDEEGVAPGESVARVDPAAPDEPMVPGGERGPAGREAADADEVPDDTAAAGEGVGSAAAGADATPDGIDAAAEGQPAAGQDAATTIAGDATGGEDGGDDSPYADAMSPDAGAEEADAGFERRGPPPDIEDATALAGDHHPSDAADTEPAADGRPTRLVVYRAVYRWTRKGPDRGKWEVDITAEADAPLQAVSDVVRGVQRRAGEEADPELLGPEALRQALSDRPWAAAM